MSRTGPSILCCSCALPRAFQSGFRSQKKVCEAIANFNSQSCSCCTTPCREASTSCNRLGNMIDPAWSVGAYSRASVQDSLCSFLVCVALQILMRLVYLALRPWSTTSSGQSINRAQLAEVVGTSAAMSWLCSRQHHSAAHVATLDTQYRPQAVGLPCPA